MPFLCIIYHEELPNSISLVNIGSGVGAGVGEVITQPIMETLPELTGELLLQASFKLEAISHHLVS